MGFELFERAEDLPSLWDDLAENFFQKKEFLRFLERVNPCGQKYHLHRAQRILLITYRLRLNLFTFAKKSFCVKITIAGIPLSVASTGYVCPCDGRSTLENYLKKFPMVLVLNADGGLNLAKGQTLPNYTLSVTDWEEHLNRMRSGYRYRAKKALKKGKNLRFEKISGEEFDEVLYRFYEEVYERSEGRLEKLTVDFFRQMDADLYRIRNEKEERLGFFLGKKEQEEYLFLFCGFNHLRNLEYDLYMNIILKVLELGQGCKKIHLGQTTAYTKQRLGAREERLFLYIISRWIPNWILQRLADTLSYRGEKQELNCMKSEP